MSKCWTIDHKENGGGPWDGGPTVSAPRARLCLLSSLQAAQGGRRQAPKLATGGQSDARACKAPFIIATPGTVLEWALREASCSGRTSRPASSMKPPTCQRKPRWCMLYVSRMTAGQRLERLSAQNVVKFHEERKYPLARFQPISAGRLSDKELNQAAADLASQAPNCGGIPSTHWHRVTCCHLMPTRAELCQRPVGALYKVTYWPKKYLRITCGVWMRLTIKLSLGWYP